MAEASESAVGLPSVTVVGLLADMEKTQTKKLNPRRSVGDRALFICGWWAWWSGWWEERRWLYYRNP